MRRLFTTNEAAKRGLTEDALAWGARTGRWRRVVRGVYLEGPEPPNAFDVARARVLAARGVASGALAAVLHGLDGVTLDDRPLRRRNLPPERITEVEGIRCTDGLQTLVDLAAVVDDLVWEQALESALRKRLVTIEALEGVLPALGRARTPGAAGIRRVLRLRPPGAPPTESLLEP